MRDWNLGAGDPLCLTISADARLCAPDYANDHVWELEPGSGDPRALSLHTTYGLRARSARLFPRFSENNRTLTDPYEFASPPRLKHFFPNFLTLRFSPFPDLEVVYDIWAAQSQVLSGRLALVNHSTSDRLIRLELCGLLVPLEGGNFSPIQISAAHVLAGQAGDLAPVLFLTGGPRPGPGPYPSLALDVELGIGATRAFTWAEAALGDPQSSFELARRTAARPWEAERARIELVNLSQTIEIQTGDLEWDAAFAFSQCLAQRLFLPAGGDLPEASFVQAREPDHGYSAKGDGSDLPAAWSGQTPLDSYFLASVIPASVPLLKGVLSNFLAVQTPEGFVDCRPGLGGQRGKFLAAPMLASLAWKLHQAGGDAAFLSQIYRALNVFFWAWFYPSHDRNRDGLPEWDHVLQTGYEDHPLFSQWHPWSQGVDIRTVFHPALAAMLYREARSLTRMAELLGRQGEVALYQAQMQKLREAVERCWNARAGLYRYMDRDTGLSQAGKVIARQTGPGVIRMKQEFEQPVRLVVQVIAKGKTLPHPEVVVSEFITKSGAAETLSREAFEWHPEGRIATSQQTYTRIGKIDVKGLGARDRVLVRTLDLTAEDHTLLAPLWAGLPDIQRAQTIIGRTLLDAGRFDRPFGIPACPEAGSGAEDVCMRVHVPWNVLVGEGLLSYGFRNESARLVAHLMNAIIQNLKQNRAFYQAYHAETGIGIGERNALQGLAPLGLFLQILGVQILSAGKVRLEGRNPFPWPVTIKFRGLTVVRQADNTEITFPDGRSTTVSGTAPCVVTA